MYEAKYAVRIRVHLLVRDIRVIDGWPSSFWYSWDVLVLFKTYWLVQLFFTGSLLWKTKKFWQTCSKILSISNITEFTLNLYCMHLYLWIYATKEIFLLDFLWSRFLDSLEMILCFRIAHSNDINKYLLCKLFLESGLAHSSIRSVVVFLSSYSFLLPISVD